MIDTESPSPENERSHLEWVGVISSGWSTLELCVDLTIWKIADLDQNVGACITAQFTSIHPKVKALIALCRLRNVSESVISQLNKFKGNLFSTAEKRNRAVHDPWVWGTAEGKRMLAQWKLGTGKDVDVHFRETSIIGLRQIMGEILTRFNELADIRQLILNEIDQSRQ